MSSQPTSGGVTRLKTLALKYRELENSVRYYSNQIKDLERRLRKDEEDRQVTKRMLIEQLRSMDCKADGNTGWEERITWMLSELSQQTIVVQGEPK